MVVNRGDADVVAPLNVANYPSTGSVTATLHRFDAEHNAENLGEVSIAELELPGQSISLYVIPSSQ